MCIPLCFKYREIRSESTEWIKMMQERGQRRFLNDNGTSGSIRGINLLTN
jgi:hypothetical protein